jgi:quercetin dioxygenase-like cupin family protein
MRVLAIAATLACVGAAGVVAQEPMAAHGMRADQLKWGAGPPTLPRGGEFALLSGDPTKPGPFTVRLKMPAGYKIPAHSHPSAELVTVISGELGIGMGDKLDEAKAEKLPVGGFIDVPANLNHFAFAASGETVVQIHSQGPFATKYVNPADDPSRVN